MKLAEHVAFILICKHDKFGEKFKEFQRYRIFPRGLLLWRALYHLLPIINHPSPKPSTSRNQPPLYSPRRSWSSTMKCSFHYFARDIAAICMFKMPLNSNQPNRCLCLKMLYNLNHSPCIHDTCMIKWRWNQIYLVVKLKVTIGRILQRFDRQGHLSFTKRPAMFLGLYSHLLQQSTKTLRMHKNCNDCALVCNHSS